jgi:hypothetical protein
VLGCEVLGCEVLGTAVIGAVAPARASGAEIVASGAEVVASGADVVADGGALDGAVLDGAVLGAAVIDGGEPAELAVGGAAHPTIAQARAVVARVATVVAAMRAM